MSKDYLKNEEEFDAQALRRSLNDEESEEESLSPEEPENPEIYKYTNKGKVYEFNLGLLTEKERRKFDKMSNKEKQRFIASVELQQMPSMFDEISLKSVVYPDPDSDIADVQAAAAKYNELIRLEEDPKFKQMIQGYLKFDAVQKYITKYCPHVNQNDIDLLLKLKPDITVNQFINYYKNIMNNKDLAELTSIQKQLKNPYSDDVLKKVLNKGEQLSANILHLIINNDIGKLRQIKDGMKAFADSKDDSLLNPEIAKIIGMPSNVAYDKYSPQQNKMFHTLYSVVNSIISDVEKECKSLAEGLSNMGLSITSQELFESVMSDEKAYDALKSYLQEKSWKLALADIKPATKEKSNKRREEEKEEVENKEEIPRDEQSINADPMTDDTLSLAEESTYPVLSESTINDINTSSIPEVIDVEDPLKAKIPEKTELEKAKEEYWKIVNNRVEELRKKYESPGPDYLNPGSSIQLQFPDNKLKQIFQRYSNGKFYSNSYQEYNDKLYSALKSGKKISILRKDPSGGMNSVGAFNTPEMNEIMKKIKELGGSIFSRIKNTFKAPDEIKETKMKISELSDKTIQNNKSLRELEKTIEELTNRVNEISKQVGKAYVDRKMTKSGPAFLNDIVKPQNLKPVSKDKPAPVSIDENPDSMEAQLRRKMEERRRDLEPDSPEDSEEEWGEGVGGKIKIDSSDAKKPIPMSDFFKKYL